MGVKGKVGNDFKQWKEGRKPSWKPTTPDNDALQQALIAVVSEVVPQPPERVQRLDPDGLWDTFSKVFWAVHNAKDASLTSAAKQAAVGAHSEVRARKARDLTATASVSAAELDPKALNLGSWMFDGGIPPYVARTADLQLAERLTASATGLTVVVGPRNPEKHAVSSKHSPLQSPGPRCNGPTPPPGSCLRWSISAGKKRTPALALSFSTTPSFWV